MSLTTAFARRILAVERLAVSVSEVPIPRLASQHPAAVCLVLSAVAGLACAVAWSGELSLLLGGGVSRALNLTMFFLGLALGSWVLGRWSEDLSCPFRVCAVLELLLGGVALFHPALCVVAEWLSMRSAGEDLATGPGFHLRLAFAAALMGAPAFLMGGVLPLLALILAGGGNSPRAASRFHVELTLGGAAGALAAGLLLVPRLGLRQTTLLGGILHLAAALVAFRASLRFESDADHAKPQRFPGGRAAPLHPLGLRGALLAAASGAAALSAALYGLGWSGYFSQAVRPGGHLPVVVVGALLTWTALGSLAACSRLRRGGNLRRTFALLQLLMAGAVLLALPFYPDLPRAFAGASSVLAATPSAYPYYFLAECLAVFLVLAAPAFLLGLGLPVATAQLLRGGPAGQRMGVMLGACGLGAALGAMGGCAVVLPLGGAEWALRAGVITNLLAAGTLFSLPDAAAPTVLPLLRRGARWPVVVCGVLALATVILPRWDPLSVCGAASRWEEAQEARSLAGRKVVWAGQSAAGTILVEEAADGERTLGVAGVPVGSSRRPSGPSLLGHLPLLFHPRPRDVLVLGVGTGDAARAVLSHRPESPVDCVEPSLDMVRAARRLAPCEPDSLDASVLRLIPEDPRCFLRSGSRSYDVVVCDPPCAWTLAGARLFTAEYFRDCRSRLRQGGVLAQLIRPQELTDGTTEAILMTFLRAFPHACAFAAGGSYVLLGSSAPLAPDLETMRRRLRATEVARDLERLRVTGPLEVLALESHSPALLRALEGPGPILVDDRPLLVREAAVAAFLGRSAALLDALDERRGRGEALWITEVLRRHPTRTADLRALAELLRVEAPGPLAVSARREYLRREPQDLDAWLAAADDLLKTGEAQAAVALLEEARQATAAQGGAELLILRKELAVLRVLEARELTPLTPGHGFLRSRAKLERCLSLEGAGRDFYYLELARLASLGGDHTESARWVATATRYRRENPELASPEVSEDEILRLRQRAGSPHSPGPGGGSAASPRGATP